MKLQLPIKPHVNQIDIINSRTRFNVCVAGRRFGKTEAFKIRAIQRALYKRVWWIMPTYNTGQRIFRDFENIFRTMTGVYINKSERLIQFPSGGFLSVKSADSELRGQGLDHAIFDECAFIDGNVFPFIIRPMLLESKGSADFLSSTNGRNWFFELYQNGLDPEQPNWKAWHFTSYDNPMIDHDELEDIKRNTPERVFRQEYMAEFLDDGGAVFRNLRACIQPAPENAKRVAFGVDWGRANDYTVVVAIDVDTGHVIEMDRFNQIDWTLQRGRLNAMYQRLKPFTILAEQNSIGDPNIEELRKMGLPVKPFKTTAQSKQEIINSLALAFEQESIGIPDNQILLNELQAFSIERLPSGNYRYTAPNGMHDDTVIALALANKARTIPARVFI